MSSAKRFECEEYAREHWGYKVTKLNEDVRKLQAQIERLEKENAHLKRFESEIKGFRKLMFAIKENEMAHSYWKKVMVCLRLTE